MREGLRWRRAPCSRIFSRDAHPAVAVLVIRKEQMAVFRDQREADFRRRLLQRLTKVRDDAGLKLSDGELAQQMERGLASGRRFFATERDLARYAEIVLTRLGGWSDADHPPQAIDLLASHAVPGERRLGNLEYWIAKTGGAHA